MYQLSDDATIAVLRQILQHLFLTGHKADDKRLRNEVLDRLLLDRVASKIARRLPKAAV